MPITDDEIIEKAKTIHDGRCNCDPRYLMSCTTMAQAILSLAGRRLKECVDSWPECYTGGYDPKCCRFPKSCSATVYDPEHVTDADLEPL